MKQLLAMTALLLAGGAAEAGEFGDQLAGALYDGQLSTLAEEATTACDAGEGDACFVLGLDGVVTAYEDFSRALYRHGAVTPNSPAMALFLGMGIEPSPRPGNPDPEPLTYAQLRDMLESFVATLDLAAEHMQMAGEGSDFVIAVDPLKVRIDLDGDGERSDAETLGTLLNGVGEFVDIPAPDGPPPGKTKSKATAAQDTSVGFDNADAIWFAGYANVAAAPVDMALAHDFSAFFDAYLHRVFPKAELPMGRYTRGGTVMIDADSDAFIADMIAAVHTASFPVEDPARLAGVLDRLGRVTALSRQNWEMILAETDDNRELVPSPLQTSIVPGREVTQDVVDAWLAALDKIDLILAGDLLVPHWRFTKGVDLKAYFGSATRTDLVMLFTGHDALPYLADGPVADAATFADLNRVMGDDWPFFAIWFN